MPASAYAPAASPAPLGATGGGRAPSQVDRGTVHHAELRVGRWTLTGIAKVDRDVSVGRADLRGTVVVGGTLLAGEIELHGTLDVRGAIAVTSRMHVRGALAARAGARAAELALGGKVEVAVDLVAERSLRVDGELKAQALRAPTIELRGGAHVPGVLEATSLDGRFSASSTLGEVRARTVQLRGPVPNVVRWALGLQSVVTVTRIEAESVFLEGVRAGFVRAREITLGRDAHLLAHEGTVVRAHPSSRLGPESWTLAPAGFRR
jgi:cytoskeletal protein CcmA (bactofilin family)